ncbi:MAG: hypothetical protein AB3A66_23425 [Nodularia sp. CChRGM 3473]
MTKDKIKELVFKFPDGGLLVVRIKQYTDTSRFAEVKSQKELILGFCIIWHSIYTSAAVY